MNNPTPDKRDKFFRTFMYIGIVLNLLLAVILTVQGSYVIAAVNLFAAVVCANGVRVYRRIFGVWW